MSYSLNSLKGILWGTMKGDIKGDTRRLVNGSRSRCSPNIVYIFVSLKVPLFEKLSYTKIASAAGAPGLGFRVFQIVYGGL